MTQSTNSNYATNQIQMQLMRALLELLTRKAAVPAAAPDPSSNSSLRPASSLHPTAPSPSVSPLSSKYTPAQSGQGRWILPEKRDLAQVNPTRFDHLIEAAALRHKVDPALVKAVVHAESNFNPQVVSSSGARGLMQLMPQTAAALGVTSSNDPEQNLEGGTHFLRKLLNRYDQNVALALAAYNAGPGAVQKHAGIPPFGETQRFVPRVLELYKTYREEI